MKKEIAHSKAKKKKKIWWSDILDCGAHWHMEVLRDYYLESTETVEHRSSQ